MLYVRSVQILTAMQRGIILAALRCTDYLGILFNWNANSICFEEGRKTLSIPQAKNIVLETTYSFVHRIESLMLNLCHEVNKSFIEPKNLTHDPAIIPCALWILYSALNSLKRLQWDAEGLVNLVLCNILSSKNYRD